MKVLWLTIAPLPEAISLLTNNSVELRASGGWLLGAAKALVLHDDIELSIASVSDKVNEVRRLKGAQITHYLIPFGKGNRVYNKEYEPYWKVVEDMVKPDVVHIHGTELTHMLAYVKACGNSNVVVSIQGLKWIYYRYYLGTLTFRDVIKNMTFHDLIKGSLYRSKKEFFETGKYEIELIQAVKNVIGRTDWDCAHTWAVNPNRRYYFCNETLRDVFYTSRKWDSATCQKHSIFLSQAYYPVKGLHKVIEAMPLVLRHYPDAVLKVAGADITRSEGMWGLLHFNGYGKYVKRQIKKLNLSGKVQFLGPLNAEQMVSEYLNANVFICPSSIENSPNSLGEAQILGTPHISSFVGGSMNMMRGNEGNLYRFEEVEMLAYKICKIFENPEHSHDMIAEAANRHSQENNATQLLEIYKKIIEDNR